MICEALKLNSSLTTLNLNSNICKRMLYSPIHLSEMKHTTENNIGSEGCRLLCDTLKNNNTLAALYLCSEKKEKKEKNNCNELSSCFDSLNVETENNIGSEGFKFFGDFVKENDTLSVLDLGGDRTRNRMQ